MHTGSSRDIETTSFDPDNEFLNFLYLVYLLYCYFTVIYENPDYSFYLSVSMSRDDPVSHVYHQSSPCTTKAHLCSGICERVFYMICLRFVRDKRGSVWVYLSTSVGF